MSSKQRRRLDFAEQNGCLKVIKFWALALCGFLLLSTAMKASAQDLASKDELYEGKEFASAFADPKDDPDLPNVLLIGDSISNAYTVDVRKLLVGKADVFRIPSNGKHASFGSKNLDKWLGTRKWDVIHFNWGLWDICYRNPKSKTQGHRDKVNGTLTASLDQYRESMEKIVARLKKTEATLIWCATTPVPEHEAGRKMGDEIKYNAIAESIMLKNDVLVNDLHAHALKRLPEIQIKKGDVHFTSDGSAYLAEQVAQTVSAALESGENVSHQKPNIVFIMADDLGPGWVDFDGGNDKINTPNLQRIAEGGMAFSRAYAAASVCSPTRAACITGMSPAQIGLTTHIPGKAGRRHAPPKGGPADATSINALLLNLPSYARELKKLGYATGFLGKWHLAGEGSIDTEDGIVDSQYHPEHFGFDSNIGGCAYGQPKSWFDPFSNGTITDKTKDEYLTDRLGDEAAEFIKDNKDGPFHLSLWLYSVHRPIKAPKDLVQRNGGNAYLAMLESMDNAVGKVLDAIDDAGVRDNTLVVFYSDNGGDKPTTWLAEKKGSLLEGGLRVPMAVSWPGVIAAGSKTAEPVTSMDFFPTFVHAAGGSTKEISQLEGADLMPLFRGEQKLDRDYLYWHYPHNRKGVKYNMGSVVLSRDWKLYQGLGVVPDALFNLQNDSMEQDNVLSKNPEVAKRLRGQLNQWLTKVNAQTVEPSSTANAAAAKDSDADKSKNPKEKHSWTLGYKPDKTVTFSEPAEGEPLKLDCFFPADHKAGGNNGCIILFFGGGWSSGDTSQFHGHSKYFASRGLVAISAQYRTRQSHKATPRNCVEDGKAAIRFVRSQAKEFGIDPSKVVVGGGSAGGHVAAACAMCPKLDASPESQISSMPNALMLFNPVYDNGPKGYGHDRVKAYWKDISPMQNICPDLPPTIVFFGDRDKYVPVTAINTFQQKMVDARNQSETHIYKGQAHGFFHISKGGRKMFEDVLTKADAFLVKNGFITGPDNVAAWTAETVAKLPAKGPKKRQNRKRKRSVPAAEQSPKTSTTRANQ